MIQNSDIDLKDLITIALFVMVPLASVGLAYQYLSVFFASLLALLLASYFGGFLFLNGIAHLRGVLATAIVQEIDLEHEQHYRLADVVGRPLKQFNSTFYLPLWWRPGLEVPVLRHPTLPTVVALGPRILIKLIPDKARRGHLLSAWLSARRQP